MYYDTSKNDHGLPYNPFKALTVPRPIGWISTVNKKGIGNLAPYSYFNGLSYDPPFVMFSAGNRADGSKKDSVLNAEDTGEFVVNMSTWDTRHQMNDTSLASIIHLMTCVPCTHINNKFTSIFSI